MVKKWLRKLGALLGVGVVLALVAAPVLAAYQCVITITNSSNSSYSNLPFDVPMSNSYLASNGYSSPSMLDVQIKSGGTILPFMPTTTDTMTVLPSLATNSSQTLTWSSGNTPATSFPIIVGDGGYITTPYTSSLDLGTNFEIEINGYVNQDGTGLIANLDGGTVAIAVGGSNSLIAEIDEVSNEVDFHLSDVPSGVYDITLSGDGSHYVFSDGITSDTEVETTGTQELSDDWQWNTDGISMPYINYIKVSTSSTTFNLSTSTQISIPYGNMIPIPNSTCQDSTYFYVLAANSLMSNDVSVLKVDKATGDLAARYDIGLAYNFTSGGYTIDHSQLMTIDNGYLFLAEPNYGSSFGYGYSCEIDKIDTSTMSLVTQISPVSSAASICSDGTYLYVVGSGESHLEIAKILESDMSTVSTTGTITDYPYPGSIICDSSNVYVRGFTSQYGGGSGIIETFAKSDFTELDYDSGTLLSECTPLDYQDGIIYGIFHTTGPSYNGIYAYATAIPLEQTGSWDSYAPELFESICSDTSSLYIASQTNIFCVDIGTLVTTANGSLTDNTASNILVDTSDLYVTDIISSLPKIRDFTSGTAQVLLYQPNAIIQGTDLPDMSGNGCDGVIYWGTNPAYTSSSVSPIVVPTTTTTTPTSTTTPVPIPPNNVTTVPAIVNGITGNTGPNTVPVDSNFPLYGIFAMMGTLLNVPTVIMINIGAIFLIVAVGVGCLISKLGPLLTGAFMVVIGVLLLVTHIFDYWMVFMLVTFICLSWLLPKQTQVIG